MAEPLFERSVLISSDRSRSPSSEAPLEGPQRSSSQVLELDEVATAAAQAVQTLLNSGATAVAGAGAAGAAAAAPPPIPPPLPPGWHVKESLSHPGYCYYFHQSTGVCSWQSPVTATPPPAAAAAAAQPTAEGSGEGDDDSQRQEPKPAVVTSRIGEAADARDAPAAVPPPPARSSGAGAPASISRKRAGEEGPAAAPPAKRSRLASDRPKQVRILHILKKHKDSRRPSSWRQPTISISKAEARGELEELLGVLREESGDDLRATFEELARTESDCSSAKRGGDLGFFGPKKMQPPFEEASFALEVGELSGLVESSSGVHILLRIG